MPNEPTIPTTPRSEWNLLRTDTVKGICITIVAKTMADKREAATATYDIFQRGTTGDWSDEVNGQVRWYNGLQVDRQLKRITITSTGKDIDLSKYYQFIPSTQLL